MYNVLTPGIIFSGGAGSSSAVTIAAGFSTVVIVCSSGSALAAYVRNEQN